jgi:NPCBM/NEW2 domain
MILSLLRLRGLTPPAQAMLLLFTLIVNGSSRLVAAEDPARPTFVLTLADGSKVSGPLEQIGEKWSVRLGGEKPVKASGSEVIELRREKASLPSWPRNEQIILTNGDRLAGAVRELIGDRLLVRAELGKETDLTVPLSAVSVIWVVAPDGRDNADKWRRRLVTAKRSRDTVYLRNGDIIEGTLNAINGQSRDARIESAKKEMTVPFSKIAVIAFNSALMLPLQPKGVHARLILDSGCRLTLDSAQVDRDVLTGKTVFGGQVAIPLDRIMGIDWLGGCVVYLSDLKPRAYQFRSFLAGAHWPYQTDASVMETDLRLGGQLYDKGLGVHTASRLTYALDPDDRAFEALVGLDDAVGKEGGARVEVLVDGRPQKHGKLAWSSGPRFLRVSVTGAKELTLVTDFADFGDVQGCVDWANARLIRNQK